MECGQTSSIALVLADSLKSELTPGDYRKE